MKTQKNIQKSNLDERQEQILLKIEHNGCWFAFWALLAALVVQQFIYGFDFRYFAGEWIVFMALAIYLMSACLRNGIWDRHLKANTKTNLLVSAIAGAISGLIFFALTLARFSKSLQGSAAAGIFFGIGIFVVCYIVLWIMSRALRRKQAKLEGEPEDE